MSIKIENIVTPSSEQWKSIIVGMRHPLLSYDRMDTCFGDIDGMYCEYCEPNKNGCEMTKHGGGQEIGPNDLDLMTRLRNAGPEHRKFMRMITVYMDITAPLYWWKEFDTYKVGTVANSCSTMHKIHAKEFTLEDFSCEHLKPRSLVNLKLTVKELNIWRDIYLNGYPEEMGDPEILPKDKGSWWQMIQLLPSSYNQKRTVMLNYEVLAAMYHQRKNHKLDEWREFCRWIETLPCSELITGINKEE